MIRRYFLHPLFLLLVLLTFLSRGLEIMIPLWVAPYAEQLFTKGVSSSAIFWAGGAAGGVFILQVLQSLLLQAHTHHSVTRLRKDLLQKLQAAPSSCDGALFTKIFCDAEQVGQYVADSFQVVLNHLVLLVGIVIGLLVIDLWLALSMMAIFFIVIGLGLLHHRKQRKKLWKKKYYERALNTFFWESNQAKETIFSYLPRRFLLGRLNHYHKRWVKSMLCGLRASTRYFLTVEWLQVVFFVLGTGLLLFRNPGTFPLGSLLAFHLYTLIFFRPLVQLVDRIELFQEALSHLAKWNSYLSKIPLENRLPPLIQKPFCHIRCSQVSLSKGGKELFSDLCINLKVGEPAVIIGENGVGKSSLLEYFSGILEAKGGELLVDGLVVDPRALKPQRAVFFGKERLLGETLETVTPIGFWQKIPVVGPYGQQLIEACKQKKEEELSSLSAQWHQRFMFLFCLAKRPRLFLLDEVLSTQDPLLLGSWKELMAKWSNSMIIAAVSHEKAVQKLFPKVIELRSTTSLGR